MSMFCAHPGMKDGEWRQDGFALPKLPYPALKAHVAALAEAYQVYVNPQIVKRSALKQFDFEYCPSFPRYIPHANFTLKQNTRIDPKGILGADIVQEL